MSSQGEHRSARQSTLEAPRRGRALARSLLLGRSEEATVDPRPSMKCEASRQLRAGGCTHGRSAREPPANITPGAIGRVAHWRAAAIGRRELVGLFAASDWLAEPDWTGQTQQRTARGADSAGTDRGQTSAGGGGAPVHAPGPRACYRGQREGAISCVGQHQCPPVCERKARSRVPWGSCRGCAALRVDVRHGVPARTLVL